VGGGGGCLGVLEEGGVNCEVEVCEGELRLQTEKSLLGSGESSRGKKALFGGKRNGCRYAWPECIHTNAVREFLGRVGAGEKKRRNGR